MTDAVQVAAQTTDNPTYTFRGAPRNMVPGIALLVAGIIAPSMGLTDVYFARATAWTFFIWGIFLVYTGLLDIYERYEVTDAGLKIVNPLRIWDANKTWEWEHINRLDIKLKGRDAALEAGSMRIYYSPAGEINVEIEDHDYEPELAALVIERAGLKAEGDAPAAVADLPFGIAATFSWR